MGYTHYWEFTSPQKFNQDLADRISETLDRSEISFEYDVEKPPAVEESGTGGLFVRFNGRGECGYETFWTNTSDLNNLWNFCKTARKPYDMWVCVVLLLMKDYYKDSLKVRSDGFSGHVSVQQVHNPSFSLGDIIMDPDGFWQEAMDYVKDNYGIVFKLVCTDIRSQGKYYSALLEQEL